MTDVIVFPDAEDVVATILDDNDVPNRRDVPNPRPDAFTRIIRTGGPRGSIVHDEATLAVESWATTWDDAWDLATLNRGLLHAARATVVDGVTVYRVAEVSGPGRLPDPLSAQCRVTQTFTVGLRGSKRTGS
jgi:hypothetical protein